MHCNPTLSADEFRTIHNALWELDRGLEQLESVVHPDLFVRLRQSASSIRGALASAYDQDDAVFSRRSRHYDDVASQLNLAHSNWSIYEVEDLGQRHPFQDADQVLYENHWGGAPVSVSIQGLTWQALWVAANAAIRDSGDSHHVYIEDFRAHPEDPRTLLLSTGS